MAKLQWHRYDCGQSEEVAMDTFLKIGVDKFLTVEGILKVCRKLGFKPTVILVTVFGEFQENGGPIPGMIEYKEYGNIHQRKYIKEEAVIVRFEEDFLEEVLKYFYETKGRNAFRLAQLADNDNIENLFDDIAFNWMQQNIFKKTTVAELIITFSLKLFSKTLYGTGGLSYCYDKKHFVYDPQPIIEMK